MKKLFLILAVVVMVLGCIGMAGCVGGGNTTPAGNNESTTNGSETTSGDDEPETQTGGSLTWGDVPVYGNADEVTKGGWTIPEEENEDWSQMEWRYYESGDDISSIVAFYKAQMPGNGWQEEGWMEAQGIAWAYFTKNGEADGAMFWGSTSEEGTFFALMRATK